MPSRSHARSLRPAPSTTLRRRQDRSGPVARHPVPSAPAPIGRMRPPEPRRLSASVSWPALLAPAGRTLTVPARAEQPPKERPNAVVSAPAKPQSGQLTLPGFALASTPLPRHGTGPATEARAALADYPDIPAAELCRHAKRLGKAAELLVDSLLVRLGERAFPADEHEPFDRILWLPGRPLRVQIKSRHRRLGALWPFEVRKGYQRAPEGTRPYGADEFDLLALVVLPEAVVKFVPAGGVRHSIHQREIPGLRARPRASLDAALRALGRDAAVPQPAEPDAA